MSTTDFEFLLKYLFLQFFVNVFKFYLCFNFFVLKISVSCDNVRVQSLFMIVRINIYLTILLTRKFVLTVFTNPTTKTKPIFIKLQCYTYCIAQMAGTVSIPLFYAFFPISHSLSLDNLTCINLIRFKYSFRFNIDYEKEGG